jgi:hypothetical protein
MYSAVPPGPRHHPLAPDLIRGTVLYENYVCFHHQKNEYEYAVVGAREEKMNKGGRSGMG